MRRLRWLLGGTLLFVGKEVAKGFLVALGVALFGILGFVAVAPDKARDIIFNAGDVNIEPPRVDVDVSLGDELTEILKKIAESLP